MDLITIIVASFALIISIITYFRSNVTARTTVYLQLRDRFIYLKDELPDWYASDKMDFQDFEKGSLKWRPIERYW